MLKFTSSRRSDVPLGLETSSVASATDPSGLLMAMFFRYATDSASGRPFLSFNVLCEVIVRVVLALDVEVDAVGKALEDMLKSGTIDPAASMDLGSEGKFSPLQIPSMFSLQAGDEKAAATCPPSAVTKGDPARSERDAQNGSWGACRLADGVDQESCPNSSYTVKYFRGDDARSERGAQNGSWVACRLADGVDQESCPNSSYTVKYFRDHVLV